MAIACLVAGIVIGILFGIGIVFMRTSVGTLRVDQSDPNEAPYLFLELKKPISKFCRKAYVILEVKIKNYISQD